MKLHESDNRGGITVKTYKEHLLIYIYLALGFGSEIPTWSCWREAFIIIDRFYIAILRSRADSLRSHVILHEWIAWSFWCETVEAKLLTRNYWREVVAQVVAQVIWNKSFRKRWSWPVSQGPGRRTYRSRLQPFPLSRLKLVRESLSVSVSLHFSLSVSLTVCLFVCLSVCLSLAVRLRLSHLVIRECVISVFR